MNILVTVSKIRPISTSMSALRKNLNISYAISRPVGYSWAVAVRSH